jgi:hypothetical protein
MPQLYRPQPQQQQKDPFSAWLEAEQKRIQDEDMQKRLTSLFAYPHQMQGIQRQVFY